jgi:hypothetical protein
VITSRNNDGGGGHHAIGILTQERDPTAKYFQREEKHGGRGGGLQMLETFSPKQNSLMTGKRTGGDLYAFMIRSRTWVYVRGGGAGGDQTSST